VRYTGNSNFNISIFKQTENYKKTNFKDVKIEVVRLKLLVACS